ncbi:GAF and ANTAR domain-containing protein [Amycolatopsis kentuckyensis]|uniref:GAF and ANTAR domain-containing protein n=1 Tax=Amycolatopsis kentuckyensis TaxID=218823 RepID=UPI001FC927AC|nr:GAF and ANTAR domain-containing protein [Amycolatopsis kentuckyensis]
MSTPTDPFSDAVAGITALLAAHHDGLTVLGAVTRACGTVLDAAATGVLTVDPRGGVSVLSASDERARFLELLQAQGGQGPCLDCIDGTSVVASADLAAEQRWPEFTDRARAAGYRAVYAFPLILIDHAVGGVNLFYDHPVEFSTRQTRQAQALADLATLGLTQERDQRRVVRLAESTLATLNDRVHVGQAVGVVAAALGIEPDAARERLAAHSTRTGRSLREVAQAVTDRTLDPRAAFGDA